MDMLAATVRQHQIRPFTFGNHPAVMQPQCLRRVFAYQANGLREGKGVAPVVGDAESGIQQAGGIIVGGENIQ